MNPPQNNDLDFIGIKTKNKKKVKTRKKKQNKK